MIMLCCSTTRSVKNTEWPTDSCVVQVVFFFGLSTEKCSERLVSSRTIKQVRTWSCFQTCGFKTRCWVCAYSAGILD